jgi:hypothetical protein
MESTTWLKVSAALECLAAGQSPEQATRTKALAESYRNAQARVEDPEVDEVDSLSL